jgi:hypothetical protein
MASVTRRRLRHSVPAAALGLLAATCWAGVTTPANPTAAAELRLSGPYVYENLDVYLIHGPDAQAGHKLVPLARALAEKQVLVRETGSVNQLTVENVSDEAVYIQAGEIVKGGKQDRVLGSDLILPVRSGQVPIASHCVEHGRWQKRGSEAADQFSSSAANVADKQLKLANYKGSQSEVWANVDKLQRQLESKLGASVRAAESSSSLQLTLENERVRKSLEGYVRALANLVKDHPDALGYAFATSGQLNSAEVYGSRALFAELWPKLLQASAVEAVAQRQDLAAHTPPSLDSVRAFMAAAERGVAGERAAGPVAQSTSRETNESLLVETRETHSQAWIHRSYVSK